MHRARDQRVKQRTQAVNMMRGLMAEFGIKISARLARALLMAHALVAGQALAIPAAVAKIILSLS